MVRKAMRCHWLVLILLVLGSPLCAETENAVEGLNFKNPARVAEVMSGKRAEANAAWWGFDTQDATRALQSAINSKAKRVLVPYMGSDWIVRPIQLAGDQEIVFEPGVVVTAKKGAFKGKYDSLFSAQNHRNFSLVGYGATFRMQKTDYQGPGYEAAEWRMGIALRSCDNVTVRGLTIRDTGGDGIYLGQCNPSHPYCKDVQIRDVVLDNNHRQGISIISAEDLLIENCTFANTEGTAPESGVDFEPNFAEERLRNCVVRHCVARNNRGHGIETYLRSLTENSRPVSILVENCHIQNSNKAGLAVVRSRDIGPVGAVEFRNCTVEGSGQAGAQVFDESAPRLRVLFSNCKFKNVAQRHPSKAPKKPPVSAPIILFFRSDQMMKKPGGVAFVNCRIDDALDRSAIVALSETGQDIELSDLHGTLYVANPFGIKSVLGKNASRLDLKLLPLPVLSP